MLTLDCEKRKLRETERCHNASLRPRGVWASRPRRLATANGLCYSLRIVNVHVKAGEFGSSKYTEYTANATGSNSFDQTFTHFSSEQGNFKEISLDYSQYLAVILRVRKSIKNLKDHPLWYLEILDRTFDTLHD